MNPAKINTSDRLHGCDNSAMFAVTNILEGGHGSLDKAGFFYARRDKRFCTPVANCNGMPALEVLVNRSGRTVFFFCPQQTSLSEMTNTEKEGLKGKHSTCTPAKRGCKRAYKPLFAENLSSQKEKITPVYLQNTDNRRMFAANSSPKNNICSKIV